MRIECYLARHGNDFSAVFVCEHCGAHKTIKDGYDDHNFHRYVIPQFFCDSCGKNRAGEARR